MGKATFAERPGAPPEGLSRRKAETDRGNRGNFGRLPRGNPRKGPAGGGERRRFPLPDLASYVPLMYATWY